jgi:hypothetical protein
LGGHSAPPGQQRSWKQKRQQMGSWPLPAPPYTSQTTPDPALLSRWVTESWNCFCPGIS